MELTDLKTMRDINDYCVRKGIPSLAQGMIELPPPEILRKIASEMVMQTDIHTVSNLFDLKILLKLLSYLYLVSIKNW